MGLFVAPSRPRAAGLLDPAGSPLAGPLQGLLGGAAQIPASVANGVAARLLDALGAAAAGTSPAGASPAAVVSAGRGGPPAPQLISARPSLAPGATDQPPAPPPPKPKIYDFRGKAGENRSDELSLATLNPGDRILTDGATTIIGPDRMPQTTFNPGYTGRRASQAGPVLVPEGPPGASVDANMAQAKAHSGDLIPQWFHDQVADGKPWDYKHSNLAYAPFGNFNYGAAGHAEGINPDLLFQMPGQVLKDRFAKEKPSNPKDKPPPQWGSPGIALPTFRWGWVPIPGTGSGDNGDQTVDQYWIGQGMRHAGRPAPPRPIQSRPPAP